jgi:hypothetical protein
MASRLVSGVSARTPTSPSGGESAGSNPAVEIHLRLVRVSAAHWPVVAASRRRHAGRYISAAEVTALRDDAPMVGSLVTQAVYQRDRLPRSRAWQQH